MTQELFRFDSAAAVDAWRAVDDGVMGGLSRSRLRYDPRGHAVFEGFVCLENGGGFASVRSGAGDFAAAHARQILLDVAGDGRRYKLNLRGDDASDGINYQAAFATVAGEWIDVTLAVEAFAPRRRGRAVPGAPPFDPARIRRAGLMIADRQEGAFALAIRSIRVI